MTYPNVTIPMIFDGICSNDECKKVIFRGTEDAISFFHSDLCHDCEHQMFAYMEDFSDTEKQSIESHTKRIIDWIIQG